jgi:hypothetical protein
MFLVLIAIQVCLVLYGDQTAADTVIWTFVTGLQSWGTLPFILALVGIAGGIALVGVYAASAFGFKTDFLIFAPAIAGFVSCGIIFTNLAKVLQSSLLNIFTSCDIANKTWATCGQVDTIVAITIGIPAFIYVWTIIEWWRGKDY